MVWSIPVHMLYGMIFFGVCIVCSQFFLPSLPLPWLTERKYIYLFQLTLGLALWPELVNGLWEAYCTKHSTQSFKCPCVACLALVFLPWIMRRVCARSHAPSTWVMEWETHGVGLNPTWSLKQSKHSQPKDLWTRNKCLLLKAIEMFASLWSIV